MGCNLWDAACGRHAKVAGLRWAEAAARAALRAAFGLNNRQLLQIDAEACGCVAHRAAFRPNNRLFLLTN